MGAGDIKRKLGLRLKGLRLARKLKQVRKSLVKDRFICNKKAQSVKRLGLNNFFGSPARTPFGYAQGKLTADFSIKDNFFLRDHPLI